MHSYMIQSYWLVPSVLQQSASNLHDWVLCFAGGQHCFTRFFLCVCVVGLLCIPGCLQSWSPQPIKVFIDSCSATGSRRSTMHTHRGKRYHMLLLCGGRLTSHSHMNLSVPLDWSRAYWNQRKDLATASVNFSLISAFQQFSVVILRESWSSVPQEHFIFPMLIVRSNYFFLLKTLMVCFTRLPEWYLIGPVR